MRERGGDWVTERGGCYGGRDVLSLTGWPIRVWWASLVWEQTLLRQWGNIDGAPAGAGTATAVGKYRKGSCGSRHCCGSGEIQL